MFYSITEYYYVRSYVPIHANSIYGNLNVLVATMSLSTLWHGTTALQHCIATLSYDVTFNILNTLIAS